jgi:hypothetical protein
MKKQAPEGTSSTDFYHDIDQPAQVVGDEHKTNIGTGSFHSFFSDNIIKSP